MDWIVAAYDWWKGLDRVAQISVASGIVTLILAAIALLGWLLRRRLRAARPPHPPEPLQEDSLPSFAGLAARPAVNTEGFLAREAELARLNQLVTDGKRVIWVTGPTQAGKTWLVSQWVGDNGDPDMFARFGMDEGPTLDGVLEGINSFLCRHGEQGFDAACKAAEASLDQRLAELVHVLDKGRWVILLDSFEAVAADAAVRTFMERLQSDLRESVLLIGSRAMPEWGDAGAELPVGGIGEKAGFEILAEHGVDEEHRDALYQKVDGLPGALVRIAMLVRSRGVSAATRDLTGTAADVGEKLLSETFDALSEGAQRLWTGICLLPAPITRDAAREMCARDDFDASWDELARWKLLQMAGDRAELHPLARSAGEKRLGGMGAWRRACGQRVAKYYAGFALRAAEVEVRGAFEAEVENLVRGAELAQEYGESEALCAIARASGRLLYYWGFWAAWVQVMHVWHDQAASEDDPRELSESARLLGAALQARGAIVSAEESYSESLRAGEAAMDETLQAKALHALGTLWGNPAKHDHALSLMLRGLDLARQAEDRWEEASILHDVGALQQRQNQLEDAERNFAESQRLREALGEAHLAMYPEVARATLALQRGSREQAKSTYLKCLGKLRAVPDRSLEAIITYQLGNVALAEEDFPAAEEWYERAFAINRSLGKRVGEAESALQLALLADRRGDWDRARELLQGSHQVFLAAGDLRLARMAAYELGNRAFARGEYATAEPCLGEFASGEESDDRLPHRAGAWWALGEIAAARGDEEEAARRLRTAKQLFAETGVTPSKLDERLSGLESEIGRS